MKTIGLVGGISWVSTVEYYSHINRMVNARLGGNASAKCHVVSLNFEEVVANNESGDQESNRRLIEAASRHLASTGSDLVVICANTMHVFADQIRSEIQVPLIHIAEVVAHAVRASALTKIGLLGTKYVMEMDFYRAKFEHLGIEVLVPPEEERDHLHRAIYDELTQGVFTPKTKADFISAIEALQEAGAQGVVLGCTEIPLLVRQEDVQIPLFDTTRLHAQAAVDFALE